MQKNFKFHAVALLAICVIITVIYVLTKPESPVEAPKPKSGHVIKVINATWGQSCNPEIQQAMAAPQAAPQKDANGQVIPAAKLAPVTHNNVINTISKQCDGQDNCEVLATSETLGMEPLSTCYKTLEVSYRCSTFDPLISPSVEQGKTIKLECTNESAKPAAPAN